MTHRIIAWIFKITYLTMNTAIPRWSLINISKFVTFYKMNINLIVGDKWLTFVQYADFLFKRTVSKGQSFTEEWTLLKGFRIIDMSHFANRPI